jgi:hypothetical protein
VALFGPRQVLAAPSALNVSSIAVLTFGHDNRWQVGVAMALLGVSLGGAFSTISNVNVAAVRPD